MADLRDTVGYNPDSRRRANRYLLDVLVAVWDAVPEQRFGQFVMNLSRIEGGFADAWEWSHQDWLNKLDEASRSWAADSPPRRNA